MPAIWNIVITGWLPRKLVQRLACWLWSTSGLAPGREGRLSPPRSTWLSKTASDLCFTPLAEKWLLRLPPPQQAGLTLGYALRRRIWPAIQPEVYDPICTFAQCNRERKGGKELFHSGEKSKVMFTHLPYKAKAMSSQSSQSHSCPELSRECHVETRRPVLCCWDKAMSLFLQ